VAAHALSIGDSEAPQHTAMVRFTHWVNTLSFLGLLVSGIAILLSHPRLYWGEAGNVEMPSLIDLPLPFVLRNQNGWGRSLHFLSAWVCVLNGTLYIASGALRQRAYSTLQLLTYRLVVFFLYPLAIWTGLAMSPALTSFLPALASALDGRQSARTIHFFVAGALVLFVLGHIAMVWRAGFRKHLRAMIIGDRS